MARFDTYTFPARAFGAGWMISIKVEPGRAPKVDVVRRALVQSGRRRFKLHPAFGRGLDISVAIIALIVFLPLMFVVSLAIAIAGGGGPILFRQVRVGRFGRPFRIIKFRTMRVDGDEIIALHLAENTAAAEEWGRDYKLRTDPRITKLGKFLRKSSLDELPQLINVLRGEMSIVGPRPIIDAEIPFYGRLFRAYCSVRPGITGIWQVSGRNDVTYKRRVQMDALYARRKSVWLDIQLIVATIPAVLQRRGSY